MPYKVHLFISFYKTRDPLGLSLDDEAKILSHTKSSLSARIMHDGDHIVMFNDNPVKTKADFKRLYLGIPEGLVKCMVMRPSLNSPFLTKPVIYFLTRGIRSPGKFVGLSVTANDAKVCVVTKVDDDSIFKEVCTVGDYVISANGQKVLDMEALQDAVSLRDDDVLLELARVLNEPTSHGNKVEQQANEVELRRIPGKRLSLTIATSSEGKTVVMTVAPDSVALGKIQVTDVITHVNEKPIISAEHLRSVLSIFAHEPQLRFRIKKGENNDPFIEEETVVPTPPTECHSGSHVLATAQIISPDKAAAMLNPPAAEPPATHNSISHDNFSVKQIPEPITNTDYNLVKPSNTQPFVPPNQQQSVQQVPNNYQTHNFQFQQPWQNQSHQYQQRFQSPQYPYSPPIQFQGQFQVPAFQNASLATSQFHQVQQQHHHLPAVGQQYEHLQATIPHTVPKSPPPSLSSAVSAKPILANRTTEKAQKHVKHLFVPEIIDISFDEDLDPNVPRRRVPRKG